MHDSILISIIVPIYNGNNYIDNLLNCFCAQQITDFEVLFINDGSTDETADKLEQICTQSWPFQVSVLHQKNAGVSAARNLGLSKAAGEYVCFVDVDDRISADYLKLLYQTLYDTKTNVAMGYITKEFTDLQIVNAPEPVAMPKIDFLREFLYRGIRFSICAGIYSRKCLEQYQLKFPVGYRYSEDVYFLWQLFAQEETIAVLPRAIYYYDDNPASAMHRKMDLNRLQAIELMKKLEPFMIEHAEEFSKEFCQYAVARHHWSILWQAASRIGSYSEFQEYCSHFEMKKELKNLFFYPQKRISWSSRLYSVSSWLYYHMLRGYKRWADHKN